MLSLRFAYVQLTKRHPLAISRGVTAGSTNLFVTVTDGDVAGLGEMCPGKLTGAETAQEGEAALRKLAADGLDDSLTRLWARGHAIGVPPCALAALDMALWDRQAKLAGMPLARLLGLGGPAVPTSVTIGLNPPEVVGERVPEILHRTGAKALKIKLGSPEGIEADQAIFSAARQRAADFDVTLRVDANGGWDLDDAETMVYWLAERHVEYVEQPLPAACDDQLPSLFRDRPLPIFVDESCRTSHDIPRWAHCVDGCNLKLMKCGGITEALRIVATARAHGLRTMIGCNSESSVAIAAGAALGELFDYIDLDSHLNLDPDPAVGAPLVDGVVTPRPLPGHGAALRDAET